MSVKKKLILNTSRQLFNQFGYAQVTIRMIAKELKMSSGNLNYHYKKREDIFVDLYFEMVSEFDTRLEKQPQMEVSISNIKIEMEKSMQRMVDYTFFWTDLYNLIAINDKVKSHFQAVYQSRIDGSKLLFKQLQEQQLMKPFSFKLESDYLAERLVQQGNTWLYSSRLYSNNYDSQFIKNQVNGLLILIYPYLTTSGKSEYELSLK
ncbi:MAG: TetR/AcrR family transcriptional regulator [Salibacteraceae bacterium]